MLLVLDFLASFALLNLLDCIFKECLSLGIKVFAVLAYPVVGSRRVDFALIWRMQIPQVFKRGH